MAKVTEIFKNTSPKGGNGAGGEDNDEDSDYE